MDLQLIQVLVALERHDDVPVINSTDYWFKVVDFLQQNWAVIEPALNRVTVYFFGDDSGIFDSMEFGSQEEARVALKLNGFGRIEDDPDFMENIGKPSGDFSWGRHPNGKIYSSGRFWKS